MNGIRELAPGASLKFDFNSWSLNEEMTWEEYYSSTPFYKEKNNQDNFLKYKIHSKNILTENLSTAVAKRFYSDVPVQIALSGGIDSTVLALEAVKFGNHFDRAITVSSSSRPSELNKSKNLCEKFSINQLSIDFDAIDILKYLKLAIKAQGAPLSHPHALAVYLLTEEAGMHGKVLITGEGADELMYGYEHYKDNNFTFAFIQHLNPSDFFEIPESKINVEYGCCNANNYLQNNDYRDLDVKTHLLSLLRRNDRISMNNSVEMRSAYLDFELFKTGALFQDSGLISKDKGILLSLIKSSFPEYQQDLKKIGFYVPFDDWFKSQVNVNKRIIYYINKSLDYLRIEHQWNLRKSVSIEGKLAWALINIGIFLDLESEISYE